MYYQNISNYYANGSGRDNYIFKNNGGQITVKKVFNQNIMTGSFLGKEVKKYEGVSPRIKRVNYKMDGTGRDVYAKDGEVMVGNSGTQRFNYLKSLRQYQGDLPFRTMCSNSGSRSSYWRSSFVSGRSRSGSPLRTQRFLYKEKLEHDRIPQCDTSWDIEQKQAQCIKDRIENFNMIRKDVEAKIEQGNQICKKQNQDLNLRCISSIRASEKYKHVKPLPQLSQKGVGLTVSTLKSAGHMSDQCDIGEIQNPNEFQTIKQLQYLLNYRNLNL